jgi:hypothetical protein
MSVDIRERDFIESRGGAEVSHTRVDLDETSGSAQGGTRPEKSLKISVIPALPENTLNSAARYGKPRCFVRLSE